MLLWNTVILACALIFFTKGFLLIKLEIGHKSSFCDDEAILRHDKESVRHHCIESRKHHLYEKLVIVVIDALRYDFAFYQGDDKAKLPFHNNMPIFQDLISKEGCNKAQLWRFKADAPTTTMQRLKGLMTGSLPTFIDVSENFASSEITEDNLLDQFIQARMNITFMGDDTWMGLFPGRFKKAFPYPSFDVKDLHLVDDGIIEHLLPEIAENDWQILIAHFLGVDHCGHRYGPFHPEMPLKLQQMNEVIKGVLKAIDNDTLLLIMGDHGMTPTGDHGGETFNEVMAALFAYSPAGRFANCVADQEPEVNQVDIVPTISLLLGIPIPFANLGIVIKDMIPEEDGSHGVHNNFTIVEALEKNLKQMHTYLKAYQAITRSLPRDQFENLNEEIEFLEDMLESPQKFSAEFTEKKFNEIMHYARDMCRMVWAKFNIGLMLSGLCILFYWLVAIYRIQIKQPIVLTQKSSAIIIFILLFACVFVPDIALIGNEALVDVFSWFTAILMLCAILFYMLQYKLVLPRISSLVAIFSTVLFSVFFTSNSFILNEDCLSLYMFSSTLVLVAYFNLPTSNSDCIDEKSQNYRKVKQVIDRPTVLDLLWIPQSFFSHQTIKMCFYVFAILVCARFSFFFRSCRAEQFWCFDDDMVSKAATNNNMLLWTILSGLCLLLCLWLAMSQIQSRQRVKSFLDKVVLMCSLFCVMHWVMLAIPNKVTDGLPPWLITVFPRLSYALMIIQLLFQWIDPTIGSVKTDVRRSKKEDTQNVSDGTPITLSKDQKSTYAGHGFQTYQTVVFLSISRLILCLVVLFSLLLGPFHAMAIPLWMVSAYCFDQMLRISNGKIIGFDTVTTWNLLHSFWWFSTGHQATLSSIRWDAAFVGFQGNHITNIIPAALLVLDTYSMQILSSVCLPVLLMRFKKFDTTANTPIFEDALSELYRKHFCYHVIKIIGCMIAALIHRRHLMVWWIFAPRFLFELISIVFVMLSSILTYAFVRRCRTQVQLHLDSVK